MVHGGADSGTGPVREDIATNSNLDLVIGRLFGGKWCCCTEYDVFYKGVPGCGYEGTAYVVSLWQLWCVMDALCVCVCMCVHICVIGKRSVHQGLG
jgi:hypothetical protein